MIVEKYEFWCVLLELLWFIIYFGKVELIKRINYG